MIDASLPAGRQEFPPAPGDDVAICVERSLFEPLCCPSTENPFLFPEGLLCGLHRRHRGNSWTGSGSSHQSGFVSATAPYFSEDSAADDPRWWLIHTKPRQEKKLAEQLSSLRVPHFLPVTRCTAITRGRKLVTRSPQFPGYLFLWVNSAERRVALETNRIVSTHCVEDQAGLSEQLWNLADLIEKEVPLRIEERLAAGQQVRVKSGLLKDKQGTILKRGGKTRLFVFINELLGGVSLEIDQCLLEPY